MAILTAHNLSKYFGGQDIFSDLNLAIHHGEHIALVGPNGEGKTTLLRILAGREQATTGNVYRAKELKVGYLEQHASLISTDVSILALALTAFTELREQEKQLQEMEAVLAKESDPTQHAQLLERYGEAQSQFEHDGGYVYEQAIDQVLRGLGFTPQDYQTSLTKLSGGQQSRVQLARLLLEKPDLLLLDEPTNHLDLASVEWLEDYLQNWAGALVVVAHDRYFLDKVATRVWELKFGSLETYRGNFSHYVSQREGNVDRQQKDYQAQQEFIAKQEDFIRRNLAGQRSREAKGRRKRLLSMDKVARPQEQQTLHLNLQTTLRSGDLVMATHDLVVGYPNKEPLFACPNLEIRRGDCVALLGPNGSGKTTFLKTILKQLKPLSGNIRLGAGLEIGYFAQTHASLNFGSTILDEILSVKNLPIAEARNYLGRFLFSGDDVFKPIGNLSGGERGRVALAKLTLTGANFLLLDEPTNHLDIPSRENLEDVLSNFEGTILLVSHDRYFVDALANYIWALDAATKSVLISGGGYQEYLLERELKNSLLLKTGESNNSSQKAKISREQTKAEQRTAQKQAKQIAEIEEIITSTEAKLASLAEQIEQASRGQAIAQLQKLSRDYQETETKLEELLNQWTELETAVSG